MVQKLTKESTVKLRNGEDIPVIGLGVYKNELQSCHDAVIEALNVGYRLIDSAAVYGNEDICGKAIVEWCEKTGHKRTDVFLTSKLATTGSYEETKAAIRSSLHHCGTYIDLYLIHSPAGGKEHRLESWRAIEEFIDRGDIRGAGVSNYGIKHLEELFASNPRYLPVVNQIELHPFLTQEPIVDWCREHDIVVEAYSPLTRGKRLNDPKITRLAEVYGVTPAQLLLRWSLQKGFVPVVKSSHKERIEENFEVFDIELSDRCVQKLDQFNENWHTDPTWDPTQSD
ncbi:xylose and arabinose reductase [Schizosaccharomyces japonicus yFS275]|uniref:Xylose and arabinose reductase n=1 Tax=Schizosaccharomyces japonicus (strain yFS275 / FY16936) TaxID=402676 RepID=B6K7F1_SCHJY|nr:xylose and arabinose reductase [Schizosaccharomyces japonicus yFS275]EEB09455.1 xylose and arabinose reductase [Schizosaccharomyces japonicus yFS275]